ncbi:LCP family protein [Micromonospora sp. NPDC049679]|uniref:LCP family protein n=1 Tax=Micromonospora sp. NPDC049679 TaxID=3155920 RepID=UPI0033F4933E
MVGDTGKGGARRKRSALPRWARWCTALGAALMLISGVVLVGAEALLARYAGAVRSDDLFDDTGKQEARSDITGPLNLLLVGIDPRASSPNTPPLADSVLILHVTPSMEQAYLFSMPRDLIVEIPRFDKANFPGGSDRINSAMAYGSKVPGQDKPDPARGFALLAKTVSQRTGIARFDAGAIINFTGFQKIVDAMGGVTMYIDGDVKSEHREPDGRHRRGNPAGEGYIGPQAEYKKGTRHLEGWQALDYVRQRKTLPDSDYGRQRHQQQFVKAMVNQAFSRDVVTNPFKLDSVLRAAGQSVIFDGHGHTVAEFGFALRNIRSSSIVMMKLPGESIMNGSDYQGERLQPLAEEFFAALRGGSVETFVVSHPELLNQEK